MRENVFYRNDESHEYHMELGCHAAWCDWKIKLQKITGLLVRHFFLADVLKRYAWD